MLASRTAFIIGKLLMWDNSAKAKEALFCATPNVYIFRFHFFFSFFDRHEALFWFYAECFRHRASFRNKRSSKDS